jgi:predicted nucleic acid-binding protein
MGTFADTYYFIALLNPSDSAHDRAIEISRTLAAPIITTTWVLVEVADALSAPGFRSHVHRFLERLASDPNFQVVPADMDWYGRGLSLYGARPDKGWSLTDCISFVVMKELGLREALTGDRHFEQAGFAAALKAE